MTTNLHDKMLAAIDAYFSASDAVEEEVAENLLLDVRDEILKRKRAEQSAQQKPVATLYGTLPVYDKPAQPLTDEQIAKCYETTGHYQTLRPQDRFAVFALARAIEAAHGITKGNT